MILLALAHAGLFDKKPEAPAQAPSAEVTPAVPFQPAPGSLWDPMSSVQQAGLNGSAKQIGDLVTVLVHEEVVSDQKIQTSHSSTGKSNFGVNTALGLETQILNANPSMGTGISIGGERSSAHDGSGAIQSTGMLDATLACHVVQILPGNNLLIQGRKQVRVGGGVQYLTLRGVIRARDINVHNEISSRLIADGIIELDNSGAIYSGQKPGWGTVLTEKISPF